MRRGALAGMVLLAACADAPPAESVHRADRLLASAGQVAAWLGSTARPTVAGVEWPVDAVRPDLAAPDLADGGAGPVLFLLAHAALAGDTASRDLARRGADELLFRVSDSGFAQSLPRPTSLYYGLPSIAIVLEFAARELDDDRYLDGARTAAAVVARAAVPTADSGVRWSVRYNDLLFGDAGTALFMVWAGERLGDRAARRLARQAANALVAEATETPAGFGWRFRTDAPFVLPNFSHGAAGVAFVLQQVGRQSRDPRLDSVAARAARALIAAADTSAGGFWIPYGWPNEEWIGRLDLGWAHGSAGSARLFAALARSDPAGGWDRWVARAAHGLVSHPALVPQGVDSLPDDLRFGRAGVAMFLADFAEQSGDGVARAAAHRIADHLIGRSTGDDAGLRWVAPRAGFMEHGGEPAAFTGYLSGASGYGLVLLRLAALERREPWTFRLPDDPRSIE